MFTMGAVFGEATSDLRSDGDTNGKAMHVYDTVLALLAVLLLQRCN